MTVSQDIPPEAGSASQLPLAPTRVLSLDILRFIACLLVIFRHMNTPDQDRQMQHLLHRGGWIGVDLFFVLSGFLVSGLLFREVKLRGKIDVTRFLLRRGLKIYPAFYFFIATQILWSLFHGETLQFEIGRAHV